jgi:hypothetical protein
MIIRETQNSGKDTIKREELARIMRLKVPECLGTPVFLNETCWSSGVPIEDEQEEESQPFSGWKGQAFPTCELRKGSLRKPWSEEIRSS